MILELFFVLIVIALVLIGMGLYSEDMRMFGIIGCLFLFLLGVYVILPNNLEVKNGFNLVDYGNGTTETTYIYQAYNDSTTHYIGYFLSIIGIFGMFLIPVITKVEDD